jgi:hypothetical protein
VLALCGAAAGFSAAGVVAAMADRLKVPTMVAAMREDISLFMCFSSVFKWDGYAISGM